MNKLIPLVIVGVLLLSGLGASAFIPTPSSKKEKTDHILIATPMVNDQGDYCAVELDGATAFLMNTGEPVLPTLTQVYILPFQSTHISVTITFSEEHNQALGKKIRPAPAPLIDGTDKVPLVIASESIYQSSAIYPGVSYTYRTSTGLVGSTHVVFLSVTIYPVRYLPADNMISYHEQAAVSISYDEPFSTVSSVSDYDLVIIAPAAFEQALLPLVDHKTSYGMNTTLMTLEQIYQDYTLGRDEAENVKLFIKDAVEQQGISYVLLVGGMELRKEQWILPVRYTNNYVGGDFEHGVLSDLYFADIYKNNGSAFEDWDSNGNDIFAEYTPTSKDIIDGSPDVYVGRLPCRDGKEVTTMVEKIIAYETNPADDSWFKRMLLIGGDTYPDSGPGGYEAEIDTNVSASYMTGFTFERLWTSQGTLTKQKDVETAINNGAGFIHTAGHANPSILVTHPPENESKITILSMYNIPPLDALWAVLYGGQGLAGFFEELRQPWMPRLKNNEKQPVVVVGGCHNSQFNTTPLNILTDGFFYAYGYGVHVPKCWSWWLTSKKDGGAIATMGNSGLGMGLPGFDYPNGLDGWLLPRFFYNYGQLGKHHVAEAHSAAIADYVNQFNINTDDADRQMVEQWVLIGDPSLMIGGYR